MLVVVSGNDGVGKSTFTHLLAAFLNGVAVEEPFAQNPFGRDYLDSPEAWAFQAEVEFIRQRAETVRRELQRDVPIVCDRYVWDDVHVFSSLWQRLGVMQMRELTSLEALARDLTADLPRPTHTIWLRASLACMTSRIERRPNYPRALTLEKLLAFREERYEAWLGNAAPVFEELDTTDRTLDSLTSEAARIGARLLGDSSSES